MLIDSHCHLDFENFEPDRAEVIARATDKNVRLVINPAVDLDSSSQVLSLASMFPNFVRAAVGVHPNYSTSWAPSTATALEELTKNPAVAAIGEIGLDYYRDYAPPDTQRLALRAQLELASRLNLPVILHDRDASQDLGSILLEWWHALPDGSPLKSNPGVMHAYSGSLELAMILLKIGFCFGIGGPVTYKNGAEKQKLASTLPLDHILLETDAPFLPPHPHRGIRNEPAFVSLVADRIATLRGVSREEVSKVTAQAACRVFRLDLPA